MPSKSMKTKTMLSLGFGLVLTLLCLLAAITAWQTGKVAANANYYAVNLVPSYEAEHDISVALGDMRRFEYRHILANDDATMDAAEAKIAAARKAIDERLARYAKDLVSDDQDKRAMEATRSAIDAYYAQWDRIRPISRKTTTDPSQLEVATKLAVGDSAKAYEVAHQAIKTWWDYNVKLAVDQDTAAQSTYTQAKLIMLVLVIAGVVLGVVAATLIVRTLLAQLGGEPADAAELASAIAEGDLTRSINVKPGDHTSLVSKLAAMQASLQQVVAGVRQNSDSVATASAQIAQGNQDLSSRTEEQASALQQTAATMEQLGTTVRNNADAARQANQLAQGATAVAGKGGDVVGKVVTTMQGINDSSRKIGDIISVIDGIAFQTNILALNAAVEAARAGEQGRGFAVVASEVRSLAQRSAEAAKEIKSLIGRSVEQVEQGTSLVDEAGKTMGEIVSSIQRVSDIVAEISAASTEQSSGVSQVGDAVSQMDQATQQNAALVEESAAAAESLKTQARQLVDAVAVFKLAGGTGHAPAARSEPLKRPSPASVKVAAKPTKSQAKKAAPAAPAAAAPARAAEPAMAGAEQWESF